MTLAVLDRVPDGLLECGVREVAGVLPAPTLIHLDGARHPALFVSALLHGDESVGLVALQRVLRGAADRPLPRALSFFVGNVAAARAGVRRLPEQPDFNRVWPGTEHAECAEVAMAREVVAAMRRRGVFASVDLHNNTGLNPHYACVNELDAASLQLATLFSRTVVHFREPRGVQSAAFAPLCPAAALECGRPGDPDGETRAAELLSALLHLRELPRHPPAHADIDLFHTVAIVKVPPEVAISFDGSPADVVFRDDLDHLNFSEVPGGTELARVVRRNLAPLRVVGEDGADRFGSYFELRENRIVLRAPVMPAMLTRSVAAVRQDCLCYLMERREVPRE